MLHGLNSSSAIGGNSTWAKQRFCILCATRNIAASALLVPNNDL